MMSVKAISLRIAGSLVAMAVLLWTIRYGYEAATERSTTRRRSSQALMCSQWVSRIGALIMLFGFFLMILGLPIIADLFLRGLTIRDPTERYALRQDSKRHVIGSNWRNSTATPELLDLNYAPRHPPDPAAPPRPLQDILLARSLFAKHTVLLDSKKMQLQRLLFERRGLEHGLPFLPSTFTSTTMTETL
ncbi:putative transmembrane protein [Senna tora]|uniref:Putative transmembrane protein n=1 Tax=Senna tora TaxID=362788 RepID=A0A834XBE6_9FABA|nr:putative transmembrane protein [Senna tora]